MISLHNWLNNLVQSFTFYGDRAGGGGTVGGGKPSSLAPQGQPNMPSQPMFAGGGRPFNLNPALVNYSRPPNLASQGMPTMPQGMNQPQGLPMQGGSFAGGLPSAQQPQSMPMQSNSFAGGGRPFNPQALQNIPYLMNFGGNRPPPGMGQPQGRPFNPQANQNTPYLINNKPTPNFTSQRQPMQGLMQGVPFK